MRVFRHRGPAAHARGEAAPPPGAWDDGRLADELRQVPSPTAEEKDLERQKKALEPCFADMWIVDLRDNRLCRFEWMRTSFFLNIRELNLNGNGLTAMPIEITELKHLRLLSLSYQHIGPTLPSAIGNLTALEYLALYNNDLVWLPPELTKLTRVTQLWFSGNTRLPRDLQYMGSGKNEVQAVFAKAEKYFTKYLHQAQVPVLTWMWIAKLPAESKPEYLRNSAFKDVMVAIGKMLWKMQVELIPELIQAAENCDDF